MRKMGQREIGLLGQQAGGPQVPMNSWADSKELVSLVITGIKTSA